MGRAELALLVAGALTGALSWTAIAGDEHDTVGTSVGVGLTSTDLRERVRAGIDAQRVVVERTRATVHAKLDDASAQRAARARAAYRVLRSAGGDGIGGNVEAWLSTARRRAAARFLLARDRSEVGLLADEAARLAAAQLGLDGDAAKAAAMLAPVASLMWPVDRGTIARDFGPFVHDRTGAVLSRRGVDIDTEARAEVHAPGAGIVRYAGVIRGLDDGVVLDHGTYLTVLGKLADLGVTVGDPVELGQVVGHAARKRVYFEVRLPIGPGGTPVAPTSVATPPR